MPEKNDFLQKAEAEMKRRNEAYKAWWDALSEERREQYKTLKVFNTEGGNNVEYHFKKCRDILDLIN